VPKLLLIIFIFLLLLCIKGYAQNIDSTLNNLQNIPTKYITGINKKVTQYTNRITSKTEKTLTKLSRWENRIKGLLERASPETANRLFGNNQLTFTTLLQQLKNGEAITLQYQTTYNKYRDDVTTSIKYLAQQKEYLHSHVIKKVLTTKTKMEQLATEEDKVEAIKQFIKERKKQLIEQAFRQLGHSKYLTKINQEIWYYGETMKNYRELFNDSKKAEETVKGILNKIPAFTKFMRENSLLNSMFAQSGGLESTSGIGGLQTREGIGELIQQRIATGGPNAMQQVQQNIQMGQNELNNMKDKLLKSPTFGNGGGTLPDFKVKPEKVKTFKQRLQYNTSLQFVKNNSLMPAVADIAFGVGYRMSEKFIAGIQIGYKLGMGRIERIRFSNQGINFRSFIDSKLKGQLYISGGIEMNYLSKLPQRATAIKYSNGWQQSILTGLTKKINIKTKWVKETQLSVLFDFLANQYLPKRNPILFRVGYNF